MTHRMADSIRASITSLDQVVGPAVAASGDRLAMEQVALMSRYLGFLAQRIGLLHERARADLRIHAEIAAGIIEILDEESPSSLRSARAAATLALASPELGHLALEEACRRVRTEVSCVVRARKPDDPTRRAIDQLVIDQSRAFIALQRSWFAPMMWEADPGAIPTLESVLACDAKPPVS